MQYLFPAQQFHTSCHSSNISLVIRGYLSVAGSLIDSWNGLSQSIADGATDEGRKRLQVCVGEKKPLGTLAVIHF